MDSRECIDTGKTVIGIELGSTRIKAVLTDYSGKVLAQGSHGWENQYVDGIWTYSIDRIWEGLQSAYSDLLQNVKQQYDTVIRTVSAIGFSAMMHGYLAFDSDGCLLVPFRTWRNTITEEAASKLTEAFSFNVPQRYSIAHLYQAILNGEEHVKEIAYFTTLAGYIHWQLTGEKVLGIGDASGMFPIDSSTGEYNQTYISRFETLLKDYHFDWTLSDILPKILKAGDRAGQLTREGAARLDLSGNLQSGIPVCPPEGDAGTGMTATNSVAVRTGNVSAGTSIFAMIVMERALKGVHKEIDIVTTPSGDDVAMVHCNNCTSDLNAWANLFREYSDAMGMKVDTDKLYTTLFRAALAGSPDCGGLTGFNYYSGEPVTGFEEGRPVFIRNVNSDFTLANFMRHHLYSAVSSLKYGLDILLYDEQVKVDKLYGHGGFFKTEEVGQRILSAAVGEPVTVMKTAGEGGAWGIALLALYMINASGRSLAQYLEQEIFVGEEGITITATPEEMEGFRQYMNVFVNSFAVEQAAIDGVK